MIVGAGASGGMDAGNLLKPMLARGEIRLIGATTLNEYRKYIEKDGALERRLQKIQVGAPSVEDTITILRGIKDRFELFHSVNIKDNALIAAATLSDRYITDRFLPDKAIDLVDEACATIKMQMASVPTELDTLTRKIMSLEIELEAIKKEKDEISKKRREDLESEITRLKDDEAIMRSKWEEEKNLNDEINKKKEELETAENNYDLESAARLRHGEIPKLESELESLRKKIDTEMLSDTVGSEDIARIIAKWTNIPIDKLVSGEKEKLLNLKDNLKKKVIGQENAINAVSDAIIRARSGIKDPNKPIGSFIFMGPTGVGKTELAKALAYELFDDERHMIRIDCSEYMEAFNVSRLLGAPPGYVGYDEGGELTEAVRRNPYSIVLFDEIEKAHPDVFNILLQILDDGRITDSTGKLIDFKNTIIIMTSNLGSEHILEESSDSNSKAMEVLKRTFRPEFINRIDEIVIFNSLGKEIVYNILDKIIKETENRLKNINLSLELTDSAKKLIIENSYEASYGARPIKRYVTHNIESLIADKIIRDEIKPNTKLIIDAENDKLIVK